MWKWVKTDVLPLTKVLAKEIAGLPHFEGDRPWDSGEGRKRMQWLSRLLDEGKFYPPRWATVEFEGTMYRVNGGTSSHMLIGRNGSFPAGLHVLIDRFSCDTRGDIADLFDQFDHRRSIRTLIQRVRAHKPVESVLEDVSPTDVNVCLTGIAASLLNFAQAEEDQRVGLIHDNAAFIHWAKPFVRRRHLTSRGVVAAMYDTYHRDAVYAGGFWAFVGEESHPNPDHPTRALAAFLKDMVRTQVGSRKWTAQDVHTKCMHAWNAARKGKRTDLKVYKTTDRVKPV